MRLNTIIFETQNYYLYEGLTLTEQKTVRLWEHAGILIKEANLTADQIQQIFSNIESGIKDNRTLIGQGKDAATAVNKAWEDLKTKVYNSAPMSDFAGAYDQAAEKLKQATGGDKGVFKYVQKYRDFAEKHPILQSLIYSALIAAAGITGAGAGGAAILGLFKLFDQLLQGKDVRSAIYQGAKTGALAYGASKLGDLVKGKGDTDITSKTTSGSSNTQIPGDVGAAMNQNDAIIKGAKTAAGDPVWVKTATGGYMDQAAAQQWATEQGYDNVTDALAAGRKSLGSAMGQAVQSGNPSGAAQAAFGGDPNDATTPWGTMSDEALQRISYQQAVREFINKYAQDPSNPSAQVVQMAKDAAKAKVYGKTMGESFVLEHDQITRIFSVIELRSKLTEGIWDSIKGAAQTFGKNLTTKVTVDKLNSAWKKAGSPTDSDAVAQVIKSMGVDDSVIQQTFNQMNLQYSPGGNTSPSVNIDELIAQIKKMPPAQQKEILAMLRN